MMMRYMGPFVYWQVFMYSRWGLHGAFTLEGSLCLGVCKRKPEQFPL